MKLPDLASSKPQLKWIFALTKGARLKYALLVLCDSVNSVIYVAYALLVRSLIDGAVSGDVKALTNYALYLFALVVFRICLSQFARRLTLVIQKKWEMKTREQVMANLLRKSEGSINAYHSMSLHSRIFYDVAVVASGAVNIVTDLVAMFTGLAAALISLFWIERILPIVVVACGLLFFIVRRFFGPKIKSFYTAIRNADTARSAYYQEILENITIVKVFRAEEAAKKRGEYFENNSFSKWKASYKYKMLLNAGLSGFFSLGELAATVFASALVMQAKLTYGSMTALLQLVAQIQSPFSQIFSEVSEYSAMVTSAERLMELEQLPQEQRDEYIDAGELYEHAQSIVFSDIHFSYTGNSYVFKGASACLRKGSFVLITGESGIGKSTLFKLMLHLITPEAGEMYVKRDDGGHVALDNSTRPLFSYVPQGNMLFSGTIRDNLTFLCGERDDDAIWKALEIACADGFIRRERDGLDTVLMEDGGGLSEGQAQRLAIARAFLCDASVLLLDEATSSLDSATEAAILSNVRKLKDKTLLIISHRDTARSICDVEWRISDGKITVVGADTKACAGGGCRPMDSVDRPNPAIGEWYDDI